MGGAAELSAPLRARLLAETDGDPRLVDAIAPAWAAIDQPGVELRRPFLPVPADVRATVAPASADSRTACVLLLTALADPVEVETLLTAIDLLHPGDGGPPCVDAATATGLVTLDDRVVRFASPLARSAVVDRASFAQLVAAHTALATAFVDRPVARSWHAAQACVRPDESVAAQVELYARGPELAGGAVERLRRLECAARLTPSASQRSLRLVAAAVTAYELGRADIGEFFVAQALCTHDDPGLVATVDGVRALLATRAPHTFQHIDVLCARVREFLDEGRDGPATSLLLAAGQSLFWSTGGRELRGRLVDLLHELPSSARGTNYAAAQSIVDPRASNSIGADLATDHVGLIARQSGMATWNAGDVDRATDLLAEAATPLRDQGWFGLLTHVQGVAAQAALLLGAWPDAERAVAEALALARSTNQSVWVAQALATRGLLSALRGHVGDALPDLSEAQARVAGSRYSVVTATARLGCAIALATQGQWTDAYCETRTVFDHADLSQCRPQVMSALAFLAEAAVAIDAVDDACAVLARIADVSSSGIVHLQFAHAVLGHDGDAEARYGALLAADLDAFPWLQARAQFAYGSWLRRHRRSIEAREPLRQALHTFDRLGAPLWSTRARGELRAAGTASETTPVDSVAEQLSPQELRIATLAAAGMSNREIGQQLLLSPRTIGSHLYRIYPKLGIANRGQLSRLVTPVAG